MSLYTFCREVNALLALLTFGGLCFRMAAALSGVTSKRLFLTLAAFPPASGLGSLQALHLHAPGGPMTVVFTVLFLALGFSLVWWPASLNGNGKASVS